MSVKKERRLCGTIRAEFSTGFEGFPATLSALATQFSENGGGMELAEVQRVAGVCKRQADSSSACDQAGDFEDREESADLSILRPNETDWFVTIGLAQDTYPGGRMENGGSGMRGDQAVPHWIDRWIQ